MLHASISNIAWIVVVLIQAIVHIWIFSGSRHRDDSDLGNPSQEKGSACLAVDEVNLKLRRHNLEASDDHVPPMVQHAQISEDEYEEETEQETFDGDEPKLFFELLDKTGSEMMKVRYLRYFASLLSVDILFSML